ncbi:hypothetical protein KOW79_007755 [Hemibagrus wyckioides]|uniref:Uncharacterized protein n=1 Tax=Hemibagrus wyckioides TaxID=337641 RepID=A0A9D3NW16_9TELE|nr:hypothetical protein KOW79_007755 [Hemibagrus wyckioides]
MYSIWICVKPQILKVQKAQIFILWCFSANLKEEDRTRTGTGQWSNITSHHLSALLDIFFDSSQTFSVEKTWIQKTSFNGRQIYKTVFSVSRRSDSAAGPRRHDGHGQLERQ